MKLLILGDDGRAHALVWKLFNSAQADTILCAPGNGGTSQLAPTADLEPDNAVALARWAFDEQVDLIVPAGSQPLRQGLVDEVIAFHIGVCGPSQRSTLLERSRCQAKTFMLRHKLPTAPGRVFDDLATAEKYLAARALPVMIKADHPAVGEGSYRDRHAALAGLRDLFAGRPMVGESKGVVIEDYLSGPRVVLSAFTDGSSAVPLLATRLYDRLEPNDGGPPARGMGAHTTATRYAALLTDFLHQRFILPAVAGLAADALPYWGIIGVDCVLTADGPRLTALRCSLREGEAQVVLPRLEDDLLPWMQAMVARRLGDLPPPRWKPLASVGLGLIARGYPHHFPTGGTITGIEDLDTGVLAFHSATENPSGLHYPPRIAPTLGLLGVFGVGAARAALRTTGGHALTVVALGASLADARALALANAERIAFDGRTWRADVGAQEFA